MYSTIDMLIHPTTTYIKYNLYNPYNPPPLPLTLYSTIYTGGERLLLAQPFLQEHRQIHPDCAREPVRKSVVFRSLSPRPGLPGQYYLP